MRHTGLEPASPSMSVQTLDHAASLLIRPTRTGNRIRQRALAPDPPPRGTPGTWHRRQFSKKTCPRRHNEEIRITTRVEERGLSSSPRAIARRSYRLWRSSCKTTSPLRLPPLSKGALNSLSNTSTRLHGDFAFSCHSQRTKSCVPVEVTQGYFTHEITSLVDSLLHRNLLKSNPTLCVGRFPCLYVRFH